MSRPAKAAMASVALIGVAASAHSQQLSIANKNCEVFRILPDGTEVKIKAPDGASASRGAASSKSSSVSVQSRSGRSHSSSSAFSSSSSGSGGTARAVSSVTDENGRTITTTQDERGCRVVIDER